MVKSVVQNGRTALYYAAKGGFLDTVKTLLLYGRGIDLDAVDKVRYTFPHCIFIHVADDRMDGQPCIAPQKEAM